MIRLALILILVATVGQAKTFITQQPCDAFDKIFTTIAK